METPGKACGLARAGLYDGPNRIQLGLVLWADTGLAQFLVQTWADSQPISPEEKL
jgi:hypothetical protein